MRILVFAAIYFRAEKILQVISFPLVTLCWVLVPHVAVFHPPRRHMTLKGIRENPDVIKFR
jgi:hypothetical protein